MEPKTVEKLEEKIEEAIAEFVVKMGLKKIPLLPSRPTFQMMKKAAVSVSKRQLKITDWRNDYDEIFADLAHLWADDAEFFRSRKSD